MLRIGAIVSLSLLAALMAGCSPPSGPDIVLVVIDTLRADRVSCYGYPRPTTPRIDELAARGLRFRSAFSTSSWTLPAHASIFTGLFPIEHGATQEHTQLDDRAATLAELISDAGYATLGIVGNGVVNRGSGLARGFDRFVETWRDPAAAQLPSPAQHPNRAALRDFLAALPPDQPFFAFVNYVEVHGPYRPPEPYRSRLLQAKRGRALLPSAMKRKAAGFYLDPKSISAAEFAVLSDLYDGEVAYVDALVGGLIDELEAEGRLANTLLVITSDHGENLGDHGHFRHVFNLYNSTVRVPLVMVLPGGKRAGEVREEAVSLVDLFDTILAAAGGDARTNSRGRDLLADPASLGGTVFAEYYYPLQALGLFDEKIREKHHEVLKPHLRRLRSVESEGWRLIWSSDGRHELYHLESDPGELRNRSGDAETRSVRTRLEGLLAEYVERAGGPRPLPEGASKRAIGAFGDLDPETADQLRELGYLAD